MSEFITVNGPLESIEEVKIKSQTKRKFLLRVQGMNQDFQVWNQRGLDIQNNIKAGDNITFTAIHYHPTVLGRKKSPEWRLEGTKPTRISKPEGTLTLAIPHSSPFGMRDAK
jgi:hypothetical protein